MKKTKRTGRSLVETIDNASTKTMLTVGFTEAQAARVISTRRVLPLVEDAKQPCIDARKLWEKIGKPHGRFRAWVDHYIKPLLERPGTNAEISAKVSQGTKGRPSKEYTLSRDVAATLAMQANTLEGDDIRQYFLDMERLAVRLSEYFTVRADAIVETDRILTNFTRKRAGDQAKVGTIPKGAVKTVALECEKRVKSLACEIVTGKPPKHWRELLGGVRTVRDALDQRDLRQYQKCYDFLVDLLQSGVESVASLVETATTVYGGKVDMDKYLAKA
jgi:anti-repressor protein